MRKSVSEYVLCNSCNIKNVFQFKFSDNQVFYHVYYFYNIIHPPCIVFSDIKALGFSLLMSQNSTRFFSHFDPHLHHSQRESISPFFCLYVTGAARIHAVITTVPLIPWERGFKEYIGFCVESLLKYCVYNRWCLHGFGICEMCVKICCAIFFKWFCEGTLNLPPIIQIDDMYDPTTSNCIIGSKYSWAGFL